MFRSGIATFPLDYGRCPKWLFERMVRLSRGIIEAIVLEFGEDEFLKRIADPCWFQSLGCVLGFDWNSSGLTTTTLGAIKVALFDIQDEIGIYVCGGKGKTSRKTPEEIKTYSLSRGFSFGDDLVFASKITAKVDSSLIQDGFQIYHHNFIFSRSGKWVVIQQGMNPQTQTARRYHWFCPLDISKENIFLSEKMIVEPHTGIASQKRFKKVLNLTAKKSQNAREVSLQMVQGSFKALVKDLSLLSRYLLDSSKTKKLFLPGDEVFPKEPEDLRLDTSYIRKTFYLLTQKKPKTFLELLNEKGVGPKTIRALTLVAELIYGAKPSYKDPARYSFAHGGKDRVPYPVDLDVYDKTIEAVERGIKKAKIREKEKEMALKRMEKAFCQLSIK